MSTGLRQRRRGYALRAWWAQTPWVQRWRRRHGAAVLRGPGEGPPPPDLGGDREPRRPRPAPPSMAAEATPEQETSGT